MGLLANPVNAGKFSILNILFTRKFVIMVAILLACVFFYRAFCRFLCPLGAIYGLFARVSILGVKVEKANARTAGAAWRTARWIFGMWATMSASTAHRAWTFVRRKPSA